ncbi:MAG: hypothetical protein ACPLYF_03160, partial [Fervidobacterium sp.]
MKKFIVVLLSLLFMFSLGVNRTTFARNLSILQETIVKADEVRNTKASILNLSSYIQPTLLYKGQEKQPIVLCLNDQDGEFVSEGSFKVTDSNGKEIMNQCKEISKGFYRFLVDVSAETGEIHFTATSKDQSSVSNTLSIAIRDKGPFNPYVDMNSVCSIEPYGKGYSECTGVMPGKIYDKLPCTVGNAFEISVNYWPVSDPKNWYILDSSTEIAGPVIKIGEDRYYVTGSGKITASIDMLAWERANKDSCPQWSGEITTQDMSENSIIHQYSKTFEICSINMGTVGGVTLSGGEQIDSTTVQVGKKTNLKISIDPSSAPPGLTLDPPNNIIHIFMFNSCGILPDAFTVDTLSGSTKKVSEIWINALNAKSTGIDDLPIPFEKSTPDIKFSDFPFLLNGISLNYSNNTRCGNHLIVQIFGTRRSCDTKGNLSITYPLAATLIDPIKITPLSKTITGAAKILEGKTYVDKILAGISSTIELTGVKFAYGTPKWDVTLNGKKVECKVDATNDGFSIQPTCPLSEEGTLTVYGYAFGGSNCVNIEEFRYDFQVIKPEFT